MIICSCKNSWKRTLNMEVNSCSVEISPFKIKFENIKDMKNILAYSDNWQEPEPPGHEYGYYMFESFADIKIQPQPLKEQEINNIDTIISLKDNGIQLPIKEKELYQLQQADTFCKNLCKTLEDRWNIIFLWDMSWIINGHFKPWYYHSVL